MYDAAPERLLQENAETNRRPENAHLLDQSVNPGLTTIGAEFCLETQKHIISPDKIGEELFEVDLAKGAHADRGYLRHRGNWLSSSYCLSWRLTTSKESKEHYLH